MCTSERVSLPTPHFRRASSLRFGAKSAPLPTLFENEKSVHTRKFEKISNFLKIYEMIAMFDKHCVSNHRLVPKNNKKMLVCATIAH